MKRKIFLLISAIFMSCTLSAEENGDVSLEQLKEQLQSLSMEINGLRGDIFAANNELYDLKLNWYNKCVSYLKSGKHTKEDLESLISQSDESIDGKALCDELNRAFVCCIKKQSYAYSEIPKPINEQVSVTPGKKDNNVSLKLFHNKKNGKTEKKGKDEDGRKDKSVDEQEEILKEDPALDAAGKDKDVDRLPPVVDNDGKEKDEKFPVDGDNPGEKDEKKKVDTSSKGDIDEERNKTKGKDGSY